VTAAAPRPPHSLLSQLSVNGRMVIPIGGRSGQVLTVFEKKGPDSYEEFYDLEVLFVPLVGAEGWPEGS